MFQDEAGFGRINKPKHCWCRKGIHPRVPYHHIRQYRYAYGAVDPVSGDPQDVEAEVILRMERRALWSALYQLDGESRLLIQVLYLVDKRKAERELAQERGVSQNAINKKMWLSR